MDREHESIALNVGNMADQYAALIVSLNDAACGMRSLGIAMVALERRARLRYQLKRKGRPGWKR